MADFTSINVFGNVNAGLDIYEGGTKLTEKYALKSDIPSDASNAQLLDGIDSTQFIRSDVDDVVTGLITIDRAGEIIRLTNGSQNSDAWMSLGYGDLTDVSWRIKYIGSTSGNDGNELRFESAETGKYYQIDHLGNFEYYDGSSTHKVWTGANDGAGSGLDADTVSGVAVSNIVLKNSSNNELAGSVVVGGNLTIKSHTGNYYSFDHSNEFNAYDSTGNSTTMHIQHRGGDIKLCTGGGVVSINSHTAWHAGNDGAGSGLDAGLIEGLRSSQLVRNDHNNTISANIIFNTNSSGRFGYRGEVGFTGGWARGVHTYNSDGSTEGGAGFYGNATTDGALNASRFVITGNQSNWHTESTAWLVAKDDGIYHKGSKVITVADSGSGSGFDADTLDTIQASQFLRSDQSTTLDAGVNTTLTILSDDAGMSEIKLMGNTQGTGRVYVGQSSSYGGGIEYNGDSNPVTSGSGDDHITLYRRNANVDHWTAKNNVNSNNWIFSGEIYATTSHKVWHAGNDGAGSGLDADLFDSLQSTQFIRSDANDTMTGDLTFGGYLLRSGHSKGCMVGSYNNIGANHAKTNPIYTIGSSYKPTDTSLGNMYGIGYCTASGVSFLSGANSSGANGWGMYVASGGNANIFLDAQHGRIWSSGAIYESGTTLSSRYLGISAKAHDSNLLDGINSTSFIRSDTADTFTGTLTAGHATGSYIIRWTGGGLKKITNQFGISIGCDSSMILFAGDTADKIATGRGYTATTGTEEMVVSSDGNIIFLPNQQSGYSTSKLITMSNGSITATGNVTGYSDERIKSNIRTIDNPLEKIDKISGYTFDRNDLEYKRDTGVLAQEIEKVLPEVVVEVESDLVDNGILKTVDYGKISGLLIECIKELKKEIKELKEQV